MREEEFENKYEKLYQLLTAYFAADADVDQFDEDITLSEYIYNKQHINKAKLALKQAEEVLQIEPFPEGLIRDITNRNHPTRTRKEWLEKVVEKLKAKIEEMERKENKERGLGL